MLKSSCRTAEGPLPARFGWVAGAALLAVGSCFGCSVAVAQGLEENEANQAVVTLERAGVSARKEPDGEKEDTWKITVLESAASEAVGLLAEIPKKNRSPSLLESLDDSGLIPSPRTQQLKMLAGTAGELERSLVELEGICSARVHLAAPASDPLAEPVDLPPASASVLLRHRGQEPPITPLEVKRLVAGAVSGLSEERVSVVLKAEAPRGAPSYARVGPLIVSKASVVPLRWVLGCALGSNVGLVSVLLWLWGRQRRLRWSTAQRQEV